MAIRLKNERDLSSLRISGHILAETLVILSREALPGVPLSHFDKRARELLGAASATPTFLGYRPGGSRRAYPAALCTSVNDTVVHGLPTGYVLKEGDLLKLDLGVTYKNYVTDGAITVGIGTLSKTAERLLYATREALDAALVVAKPGGHLGDIGAAVERVVKRAKFRVVEGLTGHGVGFSLHEDPEVANHGTAGEGMELKPGLVIAIEPMVSMGSSRVLEEDDGSFTTEDRSLSAHFEHTIAITEHGIEVLTK